MKFEVGEVVTVYMPGATNQPGITIHGTEVEITEIDLSGKHGRHCSAQVCGIDSPLIRSLIASAGYPSWIGVVICGCNLRRRRPPPDWNSLAGVKDKPLEVEPA